MASSKVTNWITALTGGLQLASVVEGQAIPVIIGIIQAIKAKMKGDVIEYTIVLQVGQSELDDAQVNYQASLDAINAERLKAGLPPLAVGQ